MYKKNMKIVSLIEIKKRKKIISYLFIENSLKNYRKL